MTDYVDAFGLDTVNPSRQNYNSLTLTENISLTWPFNYSGDGYVLSAITDITASSGLTITFPNANEVSNGEDVLVRNVGSYSFDLVDADSVTIATLSPGDAKYIFVTDNTTEAGTWQVVSFGVGTSSVDASLLAGYGLKASGNRLNQRHYVSASSVGLEINSTYRASVLIHTGGTATYTLSAAATLGNDFFLLFRNEGTGSVTLDPNGSELIDGLTTLTVQPGESMIISCSGSAFYTIGHGRAVSWNFTQLIKDVSAGGTITLSSTEASNKLLTFTGSPAAGVDVVVPATVNVYYLYNDLTTDESVTVKTAAGTGAAVAQTQRVIVFCDGTDVVSAQSVVASTSVSLINGSAAAPALNYSSKTNTGMYLSGTDDFGISVNGSSVAVFTADGLVTAASGNLTSTNLNDALAELQADIDSKADGSGVLTINSQTGTTYTLVLADAGKYIRLSNSSPITLTVPPNSDVAFSVGTTIHMRQAGAGTVTVTEGSGVTINTLETKSLAGNGATASITKVDTNVWDLYGNLEVA